MGWGAKGGISIQRLGPSVLDLPFSPSRGGELQQRPRSSSPSLQEVTERTMGTRRLGSASFGLVS